MNDPTEIRYLAKSTSVEYPAHGSHYTALLEIEPQDNGRPPFSAQLIDQPMDEGIDYLRFAQELKNNPKYYKKRFLNGDFERQ